MASEQPVPDPPGDLLDLINRLRGQGFEEVQSEFAQETFGNVLRVFERPPVRVRIVRDRGDWSAALTADGWPSDEHFGEDWVFLPPVVTEGYD